MNCKIMKKTLTYIATALFAAAAFSACDKNEYPVFDDKNAFVAFDKVEVSISENYSKDEAVYKIPVTLASVAGLEETVAFEIVEPESKGAKEGVNYELLTTSRTLSFNAEKRTQYIELKTIYDGVYTGDLKFTIVLKESETLATGSEDECVVTINDEDHPLSAILGAYTAKGDNYWDGATTWTMTLYKDADDDHKVWFDNLFDLAGWAIESTRFYGTVTDVDDNHKIINIPFGQESVYKYSNGKPITLLGFNGQQGYDSGSVDVNATINGSSVTLDFGNEWGFWIWIEGAGNLNITNPGITAEKN